MKKLTHTLVLATLAAAAGAAAAQSSVTVYGRVDLGVRHSSNDLEGDEVSTGSFNALGFRGVEDLGGGMQAYFDFQHRFDASNGVANTPFWDEISIVGLRGGFGAIQLGRQGGPYGIGPDPDVFGGDYVGGRGERKAGADDKYNNGIVYITPTMGGLFLAIGAAERATSGAFSDRTAVSGAIKYSGGPLMLSGSYAARSNGDNAWGVGATYDFTAAKLFFAYANNDGDTSGVERKTTDVGVAIPFGAGSVRAKYNNDDINGNKTRNIGLGYWYDLSKRTMLYGHYGNQKTDGSDNINRYEVGVRHDF